MSADARRTATASRTNPVWLSSVEVAALRAWYQGIPDGTIALKYFSDAGCTAGRTLGMKLRALRLKVASYARSRRRDDLAELFVHQVRDRQARSAGALNALKLLQNAPVPRPALTDAVERWLPPRLTRGLGLNGIKTLVELAVRMRRRARWWAPLDGIGAGGGRRVREFFDAYPSLMDEVDVQASRRGHLKLPALEQMRWPEDLDGSKGQFRAPREACAMDANTDAQAALTWLNLHESDETNRAYRKEVERLLLWAALIRQRPVSSLKVDDANAYRTFLRNPVPSSQWVGPGRPRNDSEWRPFKARLSTSSVAYALSVLRAMFRWWNEQGYSVVNPFAGMRLRREKRRASLNVQRSLTKHEWAVVCDAAAQLERTCGWKKEAADRLRFLLTFDRSTGLRRKELAAAKLGDLEKDTEGDTWLVVVGKGGATREVLVPPQGLYALEDYLISRGLPKSPSEWDRSAPLIASLKGEASISASRLGEIVRRFSRDAAHHLRDTNASTSNQLRQFTVHWLRHTHATHAVSEGVDVSFLRDNLGHASIATTSIYISPERKERARALNHAFPRPPKLRTAVEY